MSEKRVKQYRKTQQWKAERQKKLDKKKAWNDLIRNR